jgi:hypothetical protein
LADFTFYSEQGIQLTPRQCRSKSKSAFEVHIRFRYDKSPRNCVTRKFRRSNHAWFCPVDAALSIVTRALLLNIKPDDPVGVYRSNRHKEPYSYLRSYQVIKVMRQACIDAYPDTDHYMRRHVLRIDSHSNRVTAAVALANAGVPVDEIAFRLRWKPESVDHYLRDCAKVIGRMTEAAIRGSLLI